MTGLFRKCFAFVVLFVAVGGASVANASSYLRLDGVTVDPIQWTAASGGGNADYSGPNLEPGVQAQLASLGYANLTLAALDHANLSGANLYWADLSLASLDHANLSQADLVRANLAGAALSFADLSGAAFWEADFSGADLRYADLSGNSGKGSYYLNVNAIGANFSGRILHGSPNMSAPGATFFQTGFYNGDYSGSNFSGANFLEAEFYDAIFANTNLVGADLSVQWTGTNLSTVDFTGATYSTGSLSNRTLFPAGFDPVARGMVLVPEPGTVLLMGIGLAGMSAVSQRHRRRATTPHIN